jgi:hypothetical protein
VIATAGQGETQPPFGMAAQGIAQGKLACLDVNLHRFRHCFAVDVDVS